MIHLKTRSTFSLRKSVIKPEALVTTAKAQGCESLAICELGNIFSSVKIYKKCLEEKIKPILGIDLYIKGDNDHLSNLTLLCKNEKGWKDLLKIIAKSNGKENFNLSKEVPTISLKDIADLTSGNFVAYCGCLQSILGQIVSSDYQKFVLSESYEDAKQWVHADWKNLLDNKIASLQEIFGKDNFFLESQDIENQTIPATDILSKIIKHAGSRLKIPVIGTCKPHYLKPEDAEDQKILICVDKKATFRNIKEILDNTEDTEYNSFFRKNNNTAYLLSVEEYSKLYSKEILENNKLVASLCTEFNILNNPKIPSFNCPDNKTDKEYLAELCEKGWGKVPQEKESLYRGRLDYELKILNEVGLAPYFLVVWDVVKWAQSQGWLACGRGSAGGSIVSYLLGITESDPVRYNLIFERFYNAGRNQPGKISLPDIDVDYPVLHRPKVKDYIRDKYGRDKVASIATFGSLKGAAALTEVLRVKNVCSVDEIKQITKLVIDEHKISDELEELRKDGLPASILGWTLDNIKAINQYAFFNEDGSIGGDFGPHFEQAIRLENCKRTLSKHAAGLVVSTDPLIDFCPMVHDKNSDELLCGLEMNDVESVGGMKMDVLGVATLDDINKTIEYINFGSLIR